MTSADSGPFGSAARIQLPGRRLRLPLFLGLVGVTTAWGALLMLQIMGADGITLLEAVILVLFALTFGWISVAFWNGIFGFTLTVLGRDPLTLGADRTFPTCGRARRHLCPPISLPRPWGAPSPHGRPWSCPR